MIKNGYLLSVRCVGSTVDYDGEVDCILDFFDRCTSYDTATFSDELILRRRREVMGIHSGAPLLEL